MKRRPDLGNDVASPHWSPQGKLVAKEEPPQTLRPAVAGSPQYFVDSQSSLSDAERHQLLVEWNQTEAEFSPESCIHELFETQVSKTPDAVALAFENEQLTYRELNAVVNNVAHYLRRLRVLPETLVGICAEPSLQMVIGLLGILKAGGAYVPLDPKYPTERLAFMLNDTRMSVVLAQDQVLARLPELKGQVVSLDQGCRRFAHEGADNPAPSATPDNLAYVIFTSGSTGTPKGVLISHKSLTNSTRARFHFYREPITAFLLVSPFTYDSSIAGIFWTLCQGGKLVIPPTAAAQNHWRLLSLMARHRVSHVLSVPSFLDVILSSARTDQLASLRVVITAGEACPRELPQRFKAMVPGLAFFNEYGPTEGAVWSTVYECSEASDLPVPIGKPIANTQVYVLDPNLQPVPIGVPGELYIAGTGIARGYLNCRQLTEKKFIRNPFASKDNSRMYQTGDRVRWLPSGNLEFLGRVDQQVKLRGYRIELAEVETVLRRHLEIKAAVVVVRNDRLIAYVVARKAVEPNPAALRTFMMEKVPEYMVPAVFVLLRKMPLMANGKVDREALPAPITEQPGLSFVTPQTRFEQVLSEIWKELLKVERVGIHDNFFEMGGNSLTAGRMFAQIDKILGKRLPLSTLLEGATIEKLAKALEKHTRGKSGVEIIDIQSKGSRVPVFFLPSLENDVFYCAGIARNLAPDQPVYAIQPVQEETAHLSFEAKVSQYVEALHAFQPQGPYILAGYSFASMVAFEMAQQLRRAGHDVKCLALIDPSANKDTSLAAYLSAFWGFTRNLPYWSSDFFGHLPPRKLIADKVRYQSDVFLRGLGNVFGLAPVLSERSELAASWDLEMLTNKMVGLMEANLRSMKNYVAQRYPGRITIFRAQIRPLFHSLGYDLGWKVLAGGGLDIKTIPGSHVSIIREPNIRILGKEMQAALAK
jgi:amino acid adenylation domain-containing protein